MTDTTASQRIASRLYQAGCRHAFGIPGGEVLAIMDALDQAGIRFHLTKHENPAGFMAEGTYHANGAPGILLATIGPGVANAVNVVANAQQDRVPLIVITGCVSEAESHTYTHQVFDHRAVLAPITKASFQVVPGAVDVIVDKALAIACDGQPGPVHLDLPVPVATAPEAARPGSERAIPAPMAPAPGPELARARTLFREARRPLLIAGVDVLSQNAWDEVGQFALDHRIPVITTYKAKGVIPEDHELALGAAGLSPEADTHLLPLIRSADLVIAAGYDPIEMRTGWIDPWPHPAAGGDGPQVIEFTAVPNTHYMHQATLSFVGDIGAGLDALAETAPQTTPWPDGAPARARAALKSFFAPRSDWDPAAVFQAARRALPRDTVITADSGAHRILLSQMWECYRPHGMLQSSALCTMGCAVPLALGRKLAAPDPGVPVVAFIGDAGMEMILGDLATVRNADLGLIVVVLADQSLALIEKKQRADQRGNLGVDYPGTDFAAVATALGGTGVTVRDAEGLTAALTQALARTTGFTLIAAELPRRAYDGTF